MIKALSHCSVELLCLVCIIFFSKFGTVQIRINSWSKFCFLANCVASIQGMLSVCIDHDFVICWKFRTLKKKLTPLYLCQPLQTTNKYSIIMSNVSQTKSKLPERKPKFPKRRVHMYLVLLALYATVWQCLNKFIPVGLWDLHSVWCLYDVQCLHSVWCLYDVQWSKNIFAMTCWFRSVDFKFQSPSFRLNYWASFAQQRGIEICLGSGTFHSQNGLRLITESEDGLLCRPMVR